MELIFTLVTPFLTLYQKTNRSSGFTILRMQYSNSLGLSPCLLCPWLFGAWSCCNCSQANPDPSPYERSINLIIGLRYNRPFATLVIRLPWHLLCSHLQVLQLHAYRPTCNSCISTWAVCVPDRFLACRGVELAHLCEIAPDLWCQTSRLSLPQTIRTRLYSLDYSVRRQNHLLYTDVRECECHNLSLLSCAQLCIG